MITLTTDFGYADTFAASMKGVIFGIDPGAVITDITHGIPPHDIREAAFAIAETYRYFPRHTVHLVVVDPGVGSVRKPIVVTAGDYYFVGPDNGVFTLVYRMNPEDFKVRVITAAHYFLKSRGSTFHGRDIFAPVAAWLSRGIGVGKFGDLTDDYVKLPIPEPVVLENSIVGEVVHVDRFGNAITNIYDTHMQALGGERVDVICKGRGLDVMGYYAEGGDGSPHALINSSGMLEIYLFMGSASGALGISAGERVTVRAV